MSGLVESEEHQAANGAEAIQQYRRHRPDHSHRNHRRPSLLAGVSGRITGYSYKARIAIHEQKSLIWETRHLNRYAPDMAQYRYSIAGVPFPLPTRAV
jgi:cytochrome c2